jgi:hypothetical protein
MDEKAGDFPIHFFIALALLFFCRKLGRKIQARLSHGAVQASPAQ